MKKKKAGERRRKKKEETEGTKRKQRGKKWFMYRERKRQYKLYGYFKKAVRPTHFLLGHWFYPKPQNS